jgi:hypothetical protein
MSTTVVVALISLCLMISGFVSANMFLLMMIGEINRQRQEGDLISYFGFTPLKTLRIFREYRRLYPDGKLHVYSLISFAIAVISLIIVWECLHIIR